MNVIVNSIITDNATNTFEGKSLAICVTAAWSIPNVADTGIGPGLMTAVPQSNRPVG